MANNFGTIQLEFFYPGRDVPAVIGTDCVMKIDGRLSFTNAALTIRSAARNYLRQNPHLEFHGSVYSLAQRKSKRI